MSLAARWTEQLSALRSAGLFRELKPPRGVDFTSNDYLAYGSSRRVVPTPLPESLSCTGAASRLVRGQHPLWEQVETELARWHACEAALVFTSGYAANEGLLSTILSPDDWVASDQANHASLIDGLRLSRAERYIFRHNDLEHLEAGLRAAAQSRPAQRELFIVTESLFGMDGDLAPLRDLADLADRYQAHLVIDEAHATGCFGPTGAGVVADLGLRGRVLATVHTGGKALGVPGAYVCGTHLLKQLLVNRCRHFIFTTALPPIAAHWYLAMLQQVPSDTAGRGLLQAASQCFRTALKEQGFPLSSEHYVVPIMLGENSLAVRSAESLQARGWDIRAIRPPTVPVGTARLRISLHADHSPALLHELAAGLAQLLREVSRDA